MTIYYTIKVFILVYINILDSAEEKQDDHIRCNYSGRSCCSNFYLRNTFAWTYTTDNLFLAQPHLHNSRNVQHLFQISIYLWSKPDRILLHISEWRKCFIPQDDKFPQLHENGIGVLGPDLLCQRIRNVSIWPSFVQVTHKC